MTSAVSDVINWQILELVEQHQLRFSMIRFNQMLPILTAAKSLHGWTMMLSVMIISVTPIVDIKMQPSLSIRKYIFIKAESRRELCVPSPVFLEMQSLEENRLRRQSGGWEVLSINMMTAS